MKENRKSVYQNKKKEDAVEERRYTNPGKEYLTLVVLGLVPGLVHAGHVFECKVQGLGAFAASPKSLNRHI